MLSITVHYGQSLVLSCITRQLPISGDAICYSARRAICGKVICYCAIRAIPGGSVSTVQYYELFLVIVSVMYFGAIQTLSSSIAVFGGGGGGGVIDYCVM